MKKHISDSRYQPKRRNRVFLVLMIFAGILLLTGVGFLLVEGEMLHEAIDAFALASADFRGSHLSV